MSQTRQSNIELLRLVAMGLVVLVHTDFFSLGRPHHTDLMSASTATTCRFFVESISIVCVNLFILISGYFGIHPTFRGIARLLFQILFFSLLMTAVLALVNLHLYADTQMGGDQVLSSLMILTRYNWFIPSYLTLMLFAPAINAYADHATSRQLLLFILLFLLCSTYLGFITRESREYLDGCSFVSFLLLYTIGRYLHLHPSALTRRHRRTDIIHYVLFVVLNTALALWRISDPYRMSLYAYSNPLVIYGAICLFLYFQKLHFQSNAINRLARSSFAVFLLQMHPLILPLFRQWIQYLDHSFSAPLFAICVVLTIIIVFAFAIALDQWRILLWRRLSPFADAAYHRFKSSLPQ